MEAPEMEFAQPVRPRTPVVVALLVLAAGTFSYLAAFAIPQALVASNVIRQWPVGHDPRLRWTALTFVALLLCFSLAGGVWRGLSSRQLRRIDSIGDAEGDEQL